jgi:hypothetical protein
MWHLGEQVTRLKVGRHYYLHLCLVDKELKLGR